MTGTLLDVPRPPAVAAVPVRRFWGDRKPPKNRAQIFSAHRGPAAALGDDVSGAGGTQVGTSTVATLRMYGPIDSWGGWWGISAKDVSEALDALGDGLTEIRVRINSPGGEAWEGLAISNMLRAHPARIVGVVDGLAASAASFIAFSCDETVMSPGTQAMIHDASSFAWGDAADVRKAAEFLDSLSNSIASLYTEAAGGTDADWRALMVEETWFTAAEAVEAGLAQRVGVVLDEGGASTAGESDDLDDGLEGWDAFDLSIFNYAGRADAPAPTAPGNRLAHTPPAAPATGSSTTDQEGSPAVAISDEGTASLREKLGLPDDATEEAILAAALAAIGDDEDDPQTDSNTDTTGTTSTITATTGAENRATSGTVVLDAAQHAELLAKAERGDQAREQQLREQRAAAVNAAVADGRIPPARRKHWNEQLAADPGALAVLEGLAKGTVPLDPIGYDGDVETDPTDSVAAVRESAVYKNWS